MHGLQKSKADMVLEPKFELDKAYFLKSLKYNNCIQSFFTLFTFLTEMMTAIRGLRGVAGGEIPIPKEMA